MARNADLHVVNSRTEGVLFIFFVQPRIQMSFFSNYSKVRQAATGQRHVVVLTEKGDVYTFGSSNMMQLGHGSKGDVRLPRLILKGKNVQQIACGRYHSMAVTQFGVLYTWGCGESGQLAHNSLLSSAFPQIVDALLPNVVAKIACGEHHSFCLASIEHSSVGADVVQWKSIEHEELKLKRGLIKSYPNGLKTKHVLSLEKERLRVIREMNEEKKRDKDKSEVRNNTGREGRCGRACECTRNLQAGAENIFEQQQTGSPEAGTENPFV